MFNNDNDNNGLTSYIIPVSLGIVTFLNLVVSSAYLSRITSLTSV